MNELLQIIARFEESVMFSKQHIPQDVIPFLETRGWKRVARHLFRSPYDPSGTYSIQEAMKTERRRDGDSVIVAGRKARAESR
jgi:hypothetical protein